jgi:hypothetical protein
VREPEPTDVPPPAHDPRAPRADPPATPARADASAADAGEAQCPNCGSPRLRAYCPDCGQAAPGPEDYSVRAFAADLAGQVTSTDGKAARTFWTLVTGPGALTVDHLHGRRARYLRPLQLFFVANVLLFIASPTVPLFSYSLEKYLRYAPPSPALVAKLVRQATPRGHTHARDGGGPAFEAYARKFDARVEAQRKALVILLAPALALVLRVLFAWRRPAPGVPRRYGEHLVFALHALALLWLALALLGGAVRLPGVLGAGILGDGGMLAAVALLVAGTCVYAVRALRRVYALSWRGAVAAAAALGVAFTLALVAYRGLLFFTTYYTL